MPVGDVPDAGPRSWSADIPVRQTDRFKAWFNTIALLLTAMLRRTRMSALQAVGRGSAEAIRFRKYRVAPRLGTDTVRRRLLFRLDQNAPLVAPETGLA